MLDPADLLGTTLVGKYRIDSILGKGGFGVVYKAEQVAIRRPVAIKVLAPRGILEPGLYERFEREALATSRLSHPNAVRVLEYGRSGDLHFLVMEHLSGRTLGSALKQCLEAGAPMTVERIARIGRQIAWSLSEAHTAGIVHRDLKSENVFLIRVAGEDDFVKVLDFGIAKLVSVADEAESPQLTKSGSVMGTPAYLAPELIQERPATFKADLYSLGVLLFELATGRLPFIGPTQVDTLILQMSEPMPRMAAVRPDVVVPRRFEQLVSELMEKDPMLRPASATEVADRLGAFVGRSAAPDEPPLLVGPSDLQTLTLRPAMLTGSHVRREKRLSWLVLVAAALAVGAASVAIGLVISSPTTESTTAPPVTAHAEKVAPVAPSSRGTAPARGGAPPSTKPQTTPKPVPAPASALPVKPAVVAAAPLAAPALRPVPAAPSPAPPPVAPPAPRAVTVALDIRPRTAAVYRGTVRLETTALEVRADEPSFELRVEASGYKAQRVPVVPAELATAASPSLTVRLERRTAPVVARPPSDIDKLLGEER